VKRLIAYFIKYPVSGNVIMFLILIFGFFGLRELKSTLFPESESKIILIQVVYPGASPEEIENGIIIKVEDNLKGLSGVERVSSVSSENAGTVTVEVLKSYDTDLILQDVKNAVDQINSFPVGMEPPVIFKKENLNFAYSFALTGDVDLRTLKKYARKVEDDFLAVDGISKVELTGFPDEEIEISLRELDMRKFNLSFTEITNAVRKANIEITGGTIKSETEELLIRANTKGYFAEDLRDIVVKSKPDGSRTLLRYVADVKDIWADRPSENFINGTPAVVVTLQNTMDEDIIFIADEARSYVEKFNAENNVIRAVEVRDGTVNLRQRIELLTENGLIGFILVLVFLALFLQIRLAFWVAISIPIAFSGMFILANGYDLTINVISLFGMILVIGILVDDGIVIGENIYQQYEKGKKPLQAAVDGTLQVFPAVTSAVLTTMVAFSTFYFLDGRLGDFGPSMAFVVMSTLLFSLIEGAFILPAHVAHSKALSRESKKTLVERKMAAFMNWMKFKLYAPALMFSMRNKLFVAAIFIFLFFLTIGGFRGGFIKTTFFPFIERDNIEVVVEMPPGTRDYITQDVLNRIEKAAWATDAAIKKTRLDSLSVVNTVQKILGPNPNEGKVSIRLLDNETREMRSYIIANAIRDSVGPVHLAQNISYGGGQPFGKPVSVSLLGNDLDELQKGKEILKEEMLRMTALKDVVDNDKKGIKEVNIRLKPNAFLLGLQLQDIVAQVRQGFFGGEIQRLQRGIDEVKVWVRYREEDRSSLGNLEDMRIRLSDGKSIPLREIATYEIERGLMAINHLDSKREFRIEADLADPGESAIELMANLEEGVIQDILAQFPSLSYSFEGQSKQSEKTGKSGKKVIPIILIIMLAIITLTFRSFGQAFIVFVMIPFGIIGVGWGHWLHGVQVSLLSGFGIIGLIGIMVNDSLVLVSRFNDLMKEGLSFDEAIYEAGLSRFRAIILTSVTTIAGLAPLILERSFQAQFLIPMAIAVAYGLFIATFTTLILLPISLMGLNIFNRNLGWLWTGRKPQKEEVETAYKEKLMEEEYEA